MEPTYQSYDYLDSTNLQVNETPKTLNLLELGVILLSLLALLGVFVLGLFSQNTKLRDAQRAIDIQQILIALDKYYQGSGVNPSDRKYPIANCSAQLNEIDFEFSLREYLTGKRLADEPHAYIREDKFPKDPWGVYSKNRADRQTKLRDCPKIFNSGATQSSTIYPDGRDSCNFDLVLSKYRKCYLYTSSSSGDKFELAYFSEVNGKFLVYSRFQAGNLRQEYVES